MLLSGFLFPRERMPLIVQGVGLLVPLTSFLPELRGVILKAVGLSVRWPSVLPLAVFGPPFLPVSARRFRKRLG